MVSSAVKPAWEGMRKAAQTSRPRMEPQIREMNEPIFKAEVEIVGKMRGLLLFSCSLFCFFCFSFFLLPPSLICFVFLTLMCRECHESVRAFAERTCSATYGKDHWCRQITSIPLLISPFTSSPRHHLLFHLLPVFLLLFNSLLL